MASLLPGYEQEFATLSADITSKICQLNKENNGSPPNIPDLLKNMEEAKDLLENMELEVRECTDSSLKSKLHNRVKSHKVEFSRLQTEFSKAMEKGERSELLGSDGATYSNHSAYSDDIRQQLLQDNDKLEITSARLSRSYQVALETEALGAEVLGDLHHQRNTLEHARDRLREADGDLDESSRVVSAMLRHAQQRRFIVTVVVAIVVIIIIVCIYVVLTRH